METMGSLEEIILMILLQKEESYGVDIVKQYEASMDRTLSLPAVHVVLKRLEKKGWVDSRFGEPTAERGGRRKRLYRATASGYYAVKQLQEVKTQLWTHIVQPKFKYEKA